MSRSAPPPTPTLGTVAPGITRDVHGYRIDVCVHGARTVKRYPPTWTVPELVKERDAIKVDARRHGKTAAQTGGTLRADADRYLAAVGAMTALRTRKNEIENWIRAFGPDRRRQAITTEEIRVQLARWGTETRPMLDSRGRQLTRQGKPAVFKPMAPGTLWHQLKALRHLWDILDGKTAANPCRAITRGQLPAGEAAVARELPTLTIATILHALRPRTKTRARLALIATTGMTQGEMMKLTEEDIDWTPRVGAELGQLTIQGRKKGGGTRPRTIPITAHSRLALRAFVALEAWGPFSTDAMRSRFLDACARAGFTRAKVKHWRPYDLRHSIATKVVRESGDQRAAQALLGHTTATTTDRYTLGASDDRVSRALTLLGRNRNRNRPVGTPQVVSIATGRR